MQKHTFRMYEKKDKAYSVLTISTERQVTVVCHGCLFERQLEEKLEEKLLVKFAKEDLIRSAFSLSERGKHRDAIKKYDKILKNDPEYIHAIYGKTSCLITLGKFSEARPYVGDLFRRYPDNHEVIEMKSVLERNLHLTCQTTD